MRPNRPFISIGVTTFNRRKLLQETLQSVLTQTFADFEVLVGNDYVVEKLSLADLGLNDDRVRIINHPKSLGEIGNMNELLKISNGKYFTWFADDDLYSPHFLESIYSCLRETERPCLYTNYRVLHDLGKAELSADQYTTCWYSGQELVSKFLKGSLKIIGSCGVFESEWLREQGGIRLFCPGSPIGLYGEFFLVIQSAQFEKIPYLDGPLITYRLHAGSGAPSLDFDRYRISGINLIRHSLPILSVYFGGCSFVENASHLVNDVCFEHFNQKMGKEFSEFRHSLFWTYFLGVMRLIPRLPAKQGLVLFGVLNYGVIRYSMLGLKSMIKKLLPRPLSDFIGRFRHRRAPVPFWQK